ncbi:MAG: helix-turn-helix transcriptional regulator [Acholeplasmatales bacterium]|nr:helix-turn-helix transcriptional regulator [Acholeplasmatales bacterium]
MNLEVANRLQQLRKAKGLSQEELAQILGLSRQAISKWERAETSPDTDNLICLARLYNISIDKLLDTSESTEEIKERIAQERIDEIDKEIVEECNEVVEIDSEKEIDNLELTEKEKELDDKEWNLIKELIVSTIVIGIIACMIISEEDVYWWKWCWMLFVVPFCLIHSFYNIFHNQLSSVTSLIYATVAFLIGLYYALDGDIDNHAAVIVVVVLLLLIVFQIILNKVLIIVLYFKNKKDMDLIKYKESIKMLNSLHEKQIERIREEQKKSQ